MRHLFFINFFLFFILRVKLFFKKVFLQYCDMFSHLCIVIVLCALFATTTAAPGDGLVQAPNRGNKERSTR